ncbi:MAG: SMI1/KNR4 family protein [Chitinophagaceae bacterium]|nr:MAG: SMI1/KNR4 family protein [Chitinophagaceae bacterium]
MGVENITQAVQILIEFWKKQRLKIVPAKLDEIESFQKQKGYKLPSDFEEFYSHVNGMEAFYPNDIDENGFLFYPIEAVTPVVKEFKNSEMKNVGKIFIFCDYMHRSWWYGCEVIDGDNYIIGIISDRDSFKPITHSLSEFIELYINDSPKLYNYN